jgi:DNA-binding MarR family transcriptional regulator
MYGSFALEDVVRELGLLSLGTRLKRIGDRLQADAQEIMNGFDLPLSAAQFPYLAALDRLGPLGIGELSQALGVAQPGVTRSINQLASLGFVEVVPVSEDQRRRSVTLSQKGRSLVAKAKGEIWPLIEAAVADLCGEGSADLLALLGALDDGLSQRTLAQRAELKEARQ